MELHYSVSVRDKDNNLYLNSKGSKIYHFKFIDEENSPELVQLICENECDNYQSITGSENINIDVRKLNSLTKTYQLLYSYYGAEKRFVKHD